MTDEYCLIENLPYSVNQPYHIFNIMNKFALIVFEEHECQTETQDFFDAYWGTYKLDYNLTITNLFILINKDQKEDSFRLRCLKFNKDMLSQDVFHIQVGQCPLFITRNVWNEWRKSEPIRIILIGESDTNYIIQFIFEESFDNGQYRGFYKKLNTITISKQPISNDISNIIKRKETIIDGSDIQAGVCFLRSPLLEVVDKEDRLVQYETKEEVHKSGFLHRAFSVFLYDPSKRVVLIQRRALEKYHSGGLWSNSCCSHKYKDETWEESVARCLRDELNLRETDTSGHIRHVGTFYYYSDYGDNSEHEIDRVLIYTPDAGLCSQIKPNPREIMDIKWMTIEEIDDALKTTPQSFTSWFSKAYEYFRSVVLESYS